MTDEKTYKLSKCGCDCCEKAAKEKIECVLEKLRPLKER